MTQMMTVKRVVSPGLDAPKNAFTLLQLLLSQYKLTGNKYSWAAGHHVGAVFIRFCHYEN